MSTPKDEKKDLRIQKTQRALLAAMMALLDKQSFNKITVNDLCELAMVSRTTFYQHFEDKYDLLRFLLEEMKTLMGGEVEKQGLEPFVNAMLEYIESHANIFKNLLLRDVNYEVMTMLSTASIHNIKRTIEARKEEEEEIDVPSEILAVFIAGGFAQLLFWWIESGFSVSKKEMSDFLLKLIER